MGKDILFEACRKAISSLPFLNGRNAKNRFVATFDWIIDEKNFLNVLEGNFYTNPPLRREPHPRPSS